MHSTTTKFLQSATSTVRWRTQAHRTRTRPKSCMHNCIMIAVSGLGHKGVAERVLSKTQRMTPLFCTFFASILWAFFFVVTMQLGDCLHMWRKDSGSFTAYFVKSPDEGFIGNYEIHRWKMQVSTTSTPPSTSSSPSLGLLSAIKNVVSVKLITLMAWQEPSSLFCTMLTGEEEERER